MEDRKRYAGILVKSKNKCLLCKRNYDGTLPGEWSIPCGGIKQGESPSTGSRREFKEETNIDINTPTNLIGMIRRKTRSGDKDKGLLYVFMTEFDEEVLPDLSSAIDGHEHLECAYFNKNELPTPIGSDLKQLILKLI